MWVFVKNLEKDSFVRLALFGVILGVGTFAYRGIAIYALTLPLFLLFLSFTHEDSRKTRFKWLIAETAVIWSAFAVAFGSIFLLFSSVSSIGWMLSNFGFSGQPESAGWFIWGQVAGIAVREWLYLLVPASLILLYSVFQVSKNRNLAFALTGFGIAAFFVATIANTMSTPQTSFGAYEPSSLFVYAFFAFLVALSGVAAATHSILKKSISPMARISPGWALAIYWFLATALLVALFGVPLVNYYYYFAPSLTLLSSRAIASALRIIPQKSGRTIRSLVAARGPVLLLGLLLANACVTATMLYTTPMTWRNQSISSVYDVASYIQTRTSPQDEILVGNPAIALIAHRTTMLGITQLQQYGRTGPEPFVPYQYDPFQLFPNVAQISQFMKSGGVKYVVADVSPPTLYIIDLHPLWKEAFQTNFVFETSIDGINLYRYSPTWDLSQHLDSIRAYSNTTEYQYVNNTWIDGFDHTLISSEIYSSLPPVQGRTLNNQVMFLPQPVAGKSYIEVSFSQNKYTNLTTNFALADMAVGKSDGVVFSAQVFERSQQIALLNQTITSNNWIQASLLLPTNADLTLLLTSDSGSSSFYDLLQLTLTLS
jgi:hypothetical protein